MGGKDDDPVVTTVIPEELWGTPPAGRSTRSPVPPPPGASGPPQTEPTGEAPTMPATGPPRVARPRSWEGSPDLDWAPGMLVAGRYLVATTLGSGGAGAVVLADDLLLRRKVAVKALRPEVAQDPVNVERFRKEVAICHGLTHPNIVRTYDLGTDRGIHYFSMEYVEGRPLDRVLAERGKLPPDEVRALAVPILRALEAAHQARVVHRDLKPSNIMVVGGKRQVVVMDFGISGLIDERGPVPEAPTDGTGPVLQRLLAERTPTPAAAHFEVTSAGFGTPKYMAPEQWLGRPVGPYTDLYAMGSILFQLLTGRAPFEAEDRIAYASMHLGHPAPRLREADPKLPRDLDAAVARCLEKEPAQRFQSAADLARAIAPRQRGRAVLRLASRAVGLAAVLALLGWGTVTLANRAIVREMRPSAERLAQLLAIQLPASTGELDAMTRSEDIESETFRRVRAYFQDAAASNPDITYIYILRGVDTAGHFQFAIDKDPFGEGDDCSAEEASCPGTPYDGSAFPQMVRALDEGVATADKDFVWDIYGLYLSGYSPIGTTRGAGGYILGVDMANDRLAGFDRLVMGLCATTWLLVAFLPPLVARRRSRRRAGTAGGGGGAGSDGVATAAPA